MYLADPAIPTKKVQYLEKVQKKCGTCRMYVAYQRHWEGRTHLQTLTSKLSDLMHLAVHTGALVLQNFLDLCTISGGAVKQHQLKILKSWREMRRGDPKGGRGVVLEKRVQANKLGTFQK